MILFYIRYQSCRRRKSKKAFSIQSEDFDEAPYTDARFTQAQIEEVIYKPFKSNEYEKFKIEFDKRKQMKLEAENFGLGIYDG